MCVCVCLHVFVCVRVCVSMDTCMCVSLHVCTSMHNRYGLLDLKQAINQSTCVNVHMSVSRPDMTFAVEWALRTNYLYLFMRVALCV